MRLAAGTDARVSAGATRVARRTGSPIGRRLLSAVERTSLDPGSDRAAACARRRLLFGSKQRRRAGEARLQSSRSPARIVRNSRKSSSRTRSSRISRRIAEPGGVESVGPAAAARAPRRGSPCRARRSANGRRRAACPAVRHCQSWERLISAVAASSIRLLIAAAPFPPSQAARYWSATDDVEPDPGLGHRAARDPEVEQLGRRSTATGSPRRRSSWFGRSPRTPSKISVASGTRSGWATHVPSKPSPDSRSLSSRTRGHRRRVHLRVAPRRDERRHPADRVGAAAVARPDERLRVGPHERRRHRQLGAIGQDASPAGRGRS